MKNSGARRERETGGNNSYQTNKTDNRKQPRHQRIGRGKKKKKVKEKNPLPNHNFQTEEGNHRSDSNLKFLKTIAALLIIYLEAPKKPLKSKNGAPQNIKSRQKEEEIQPP